MVGAALFRQADLLLTLAETAFVLFGGFGGALVAGHAFFEFWAAAIFGQNRTAAGIAKLMRAFFEAVSNTDTAVKNKAFAIPNAFFLGYVLKVFQDTAFEVINIINTLPD